MKLPHRYYVYFIRFKGRQNDSIFEGFVEVTVDEKIKSTSLLNDIQAKIQADRGFDTPPMIENYKLMRTEWRRG
jgi:hypothetical protein